MSQKTPQSFCSHLEFSWTEDGAFSNMGYDGICSNLPQRIQERFKLSSVLAVLVGVISNVLVVFYLFEGVT